VRDLLDALQSNPSIVFVRLWNNNLSPESEKPPSLSRLRRRRRSPRGRRAHAGRAPAAEPRAAVARPQWQRDRRGRRQARRSAAEHAARLR
jgi:hypothetical protein